MAAVLTKNGYAFLRQTHNNVNVKCTPVSGPSLERYISVDGKTDSILFNNGGNTKLVLGTGTTPATVNDYSIENENNDLTLVSFIMPNKDDASGTDYPNGLNNLLSCTATYENNTANTVTITESALYGYFPGTDWGDNQFYMIAREVYDTPVEIPAGKTYAFSMTIK